MDALAFNKYAAAVLVALLLVMGIGKLGQVFYRPGTTGGTAVIAGLEEVADGHGAVPEEAEAVPLAALLHQADIAAGEKAARKCVSCHTHDEGGAQRVGPNLWGVVGRQLAAVEGFAYSSALADKGGEWTFEALDGFLAAPKNWVRGTKMTFAGLRKPEERANLMAWLNRQSGQPLALPELPDAEASPGEAEADRLPPPDDEP